MLQTDRTWALGTEVRDVIPIGRQHDDVQHLD